jgi:hypothetical protein
MLTRFYILLVACFVTTIAAFSQQKPDSTGARRDSVSKALTDTVQAKRLSDSAARRKFSPRKAALRSAILPGWGQVYNKKYWKVPIVLGALGGTAYVFSFNLTQYKRVQFAYQLLINKDSARYASVDADLQPFIKANASNDLRNYRNEYRRDIDYSVLVFLLFWGLNVVDATVDAHLKGFDVSDELTVKLKPGYSPQANTTGISLVFDLHKPSIRMPGIR